MKTRQLHKLADNFCRFQATAKGHLYILPMFADPPWIKCLRACHRQQLLSGYILWFASVELDNTSLHSFFPLRAHGFIQNLDVDERHFRRGMRHPLLNHDQTHPVVDEFYSLGVPEGVRLEMKDFTLLVLDLIGCCEMIEGLRDSRHR